MKKEVYVTATMRIVDFDASYLCGWSEERCNCRRWKSNSNSSI